MPRKVEIFTAGCHLCEDAVDLVKELACPDCEVTVYDLRERCSDLTCIEKATLYGVTSVPTVVVDGRIVECCRRPAVNAEALRTAGIGQALG